MQSEHVRISSTVLSNQSNVTTLVKTGPRPRETKKTLFSDDLGEKETKKTLFSDDLGENSDTYGMSVYSSSIIWYLG